MWFIFAVITMLAVKFTHPWYLGPAITMVAALVAVRISERLDPEDTDDD